MRFIHRILYLAICTAVFACVSHAQSSNQPVLQQKEFTPEQRTEIVSILRDALKSDPSILQEAVSTLRANEKQKQEETARAAIGKVQPELTAKASDPTSGDLQSEKTLVEFYDLQCPYCRRMHPVMDELVTAKGKVRVIYKDIPIEGPGSLLGARAVLAAQNQGGYLKLQDAIMTGPPEITEESLHKASDKAGLDWARLQHDMEDPSIQARIDANITLSKALGVQGTPTYVVGDAMFSGALSLQQLQEAIDNQQYISDRLRSAK